MNTPFWPRKSPHFLQVRTAVRAALERLDYPSQVYVGLSGGADSLALTAALCAEARNKNTQIIALCIDHQLQVGSREVSEKAARQATAWGAKATVIAVDIDKRSFGKQSVEKQSLVKQNMEAAARRARYRAFAQHAGGAVVCVAHTAEDQAENLLLSSLRGHATGMSFLRGIEGARVCRPLLDIRRVNTLGACDELGADVWHDPHNDREDFRRVAVRNQVLPLLSSIHGGDVVAALAAAANDIADDDDALRAIGSGSNGALDSVDAMPVELDCGDLETYPQPVRRRIIARWLTSQDVSPTRAALSAIDAFISNWSGQGNVAVADMSAKNPGARLEVSRCGGKLRLLRF